MIQSRYHVQAWGGQGQLQTVLHQPRLPQVWQQRDADSGAVHRGEIERIVSARMDGTSLALEDGAAEVVTALEVLEHLQRPELAAREAVRVSRQFVLASVPSREDDNPEHIQLFTRDSLSRLFLDAGAVGVRVEPVRGHFVCLARVR